jgi:hypothetical protein
MDFSKTIKINLVIWVLLFLDSAYMMYSKYIGAEVSLVQNGALVSKILIAQAVGLFGIYLGLERLLFRKSRINKFASESPMKISVPLYIITILGLAFAQASIIWGVVAYSVSGNTAFICVLYSIALVFMAYSFPWKWRVTSNSI